jgi:hypothetical protein
LLDSKGRLSAKSIAFLYEAGCPVNAETYLVEQAGGGEASSTAGNDALAVRPVDATPSKPGIGAALSESAMFCLLAREHQQLENRGVVDLGEALCVLRDRSVHV